MRPAARLLLAEAEVLPAVLERAGPDALERPSPLPGWRVRDVLAHCGAALGHLVAGDELVFTPEANEADVELRRHWELHDVLDELYANYRPAAARIDELGGAVDALGLGEWVHGGDVREPLGEPDAYASAGVDLAVALVSEWSVARKAPAVAVTVEGEALDFGVGEPKATLSTDAPTFIRLIAGRRADPARFELQGVEPAELALFS